MTGDSYGEQLDNFIANSLTVVQVATSAEAFGLLSNGQADYFFYSFYAGTKEISANYPGQYEALPKYAAEEDFYMAISKKSSLTSFLPQINQAIAKYKNNGTINNLTQGYFQSIIVSQ
jgi:ABC-type amino acid transport substrate-binding protein